MDEFSPFGYKPETGKTGIHLWYYTDAKYKRFKLEQQEELC